MSTPTEDQLRRRAERRKALAKLPFPEKVRIVEEMQDAMAVIGQKRPTVRSLNFKPRETVESSPYGG